MKKKYIALIMIVMAACFGTLALPSPAAKPTPKPASDTTVSVEYLQQIEQQNQRILKELEMLDLEQRLTERIDKKTDRNLTLSIGLFGALVTFLSIFVPMTINKNQEKRLNEQAERLEGIKKEQDEMAQKLEKTANITQDATKKSEQAVADITSLKTTIQEYSEQAKDSDQKAQKSADDAKALTYFIQALKEEDLDRQIDLYTKSIKFGPNYAEAYSNRGLAYFNNGEYTKAIEDYDKAIEINPDSAVAYNNRGLAYGQNGDYDKAIEDFTQAIDINPNIDVVYNNRGKANKGLAEKLEAEGKTEEALAHYKDAVKDCDKFLELWTEDDENKENANRNKQECEEAIERLEGGEE